MQVKSFAPMTETLATLDRDQLQKLLHYAVQENPAAFLGKIFKFLGEQPFLLIFFGSLGTMVILIRWFGVFNYSVIPDISPLHRNVVLGSIKDFYAVLSSNFLGQRWTSFLALHILWPLHYVTELIHWKVIIPWYCYVLWHILLLIIPNKTTHWIIYYYSDDARDPNSDMNIIQGLPDPTFGRADECKTQWQLSLDKLESDLRSDVKDMTKRRGPYGDYFSLK